MARNAVPNGDAGNHGSPSVDLCGLLPAEARARVFQAFFKVKPGQRALVVADSSEVEKEMVRWLDETGHRLIRQNRAEDNGRTLVTFELIKMEARR